MMLIKLFCRVSQSMNHNGPHANILCHPTNA